MTITATMETITPEMAADLLDRRSYQRPLRSDRVKEYARRMREGKWRSDNGETIQIDVNGEIGNGQHRLSGVVLYGEPVDFLVVRGVPADAFDSMDQGLGRTPSDLLAKHGFTNYRPLATACRLLLTFDPSNMRFAGKGIDNQDMLEFAIKHKDRLTPTMARAVQSKNLMSPGIMGAFYFLIEYFAPEEYETFSAGFATGANLPEGSAVLKLREKLTDLRGQNKRGWLANELLPYIVYAWNHHYEGKSIHSWRVPDADNLEMKGRPRKGSEEWKNWV